MKNKHTVYCGQQAGTAAGTSPELKRRSLLGGMAATTAVGGLGPLLSVIGGGAKPAAAATPDLRQALAPRIIGNPDAPLRMAEYFSLSCGHCANFHANTYPRLKAEWVDSGRLAFEYRDFPLRGPAIYAHALARSVPEKAYETVITLLLRQQARWVNENAVAELAALARQVGIGNDAFLAIIQNRPLLEGIAAIAQQGYEKYDIDSTPSFVINDKTVIRGDSDYDSFVTAFAEYNI